MKRSSLNARIRRIRLVVLDVDGVLTDGSIRLTDSGREIKVFHAHDGTGIKYLERAGIRTAVLSGRTSEAVNHRARELGIRYVLQGYKRKLDGWKILLRRCRVRPEEVCCVGDDLPDIPVMAHAGLAVAVANARPEVRAVAHWVTTVSGGHGAVREVAEKILNAQGKWGAIIARYDLTLDRAPAGGGP